MARAGLALPVLARSIWVIAPGAGEIESAYPFLDSVLERRPGYLMVLSMADDAEFDWLVRRFPRDVALPLPHAWAMAPFVKRIKPRLVVLLGPPGPWQSRWRAMLQRRGLTVAMPDLAAPAAVAMLAASLPQLAVDRNLLESLRRPSPLVRILLGPLGQRVMGFFDGQRIASWDELSDCLGRPANILCLGNGPSSEHPALSRNAAEAVFRVNWRWRERGLHARPQVVFVGDPRTPAQISVPILGFRSREEANHVLWRECFRLRAPKFRFFIFEEMPGAAGNWAARPTNGAVMVATAAALRPRRLTIAGIDLYQHPRGRYPDQSTALDGYNRVHDRQVEVAFIRRALDDFRGEVEILSPILEAALADRPAPDRRRQAGS
jgi:hypothetical protein